MRIQGILCRQLTMSFTGCGASPLIALRQYLPWRSPARQAYLILANWLVLSYWCVVTWPMIQHCQVAKTAGCRWDAACCRGHNISKLPLCIQTSCKQALEA